MRRISKEEALSIAYERLYNGKIKDIDKNLDVLLKAKKFASRRSEREKK